MPRFVDIPVGTKFTHEGQTYVKTEDQRVSCCKVFNAVLASDVRQKTMIIPANDVEIVND